MIVIKNCSYTDSELLEELSKNVDYITEKKLNDISEFLLMEEICRSEISSLSDKLSDLLDDDYIKDVSYIVELSTKLTILINENDELLGS